MRVLGVLSLHKGAGSTTVLVNLASGLARQGNKTLIIDLGFSNRLQEWLGIDSGTGLALQPGITLAELQSLVVKTKSEVDLLTTVWTDGDESSLQHVLVPIENMGYDYVLLNPSITEACRLIPYDAEMLVCTDLQGNQELQEIEELQTKIAPRRISLIIPNRIETKEWDHNSRQLMALGDLFGYEKIADPVPT